MARQKVADLAHGHAEPTRAATLGRPRDPTIDAAVLARTRELLLEVGYTGLTFDRVARRADVGRPAIYRRWPNKAQLVFDAVFSEGPQYIEPIHDSGDFGDDLFDFVRRASNMMKRPVTAAAMPGLLADFHADPNSLTDILGRSWVLARDAFVARIDAAIERGEIASGANPDVILHAVVGGVIFHVVILQQPARGFARSLTDLVLGSLRAC